MSYIKKEYVYKKVDGASLSTDVYVPNEQGEHPILLWLHGGALIMGSKSELRPAQAGFYTDNGYIVVAPDYRLAPEYCMDDIVSDIQDIYKWICNKGKELFNGITDRTGVIGHSAGGYLTLMCGMCLHQQPKALVSFYGYGDILGGWLSSKDAYYSLGRIVSEAEADGVVGDAHDTSLVEKYGRNSFYMYCRQNGIWTRKVTRLDPAGSKEKLKKYCPVYNIAPDYPKTLLIHGDVDTDVPYAQSVLMAYEMQKYGKDHELLIISNAGHCFDWDEIPDASPVFESVIKFLKSSV